MHLYQSIPQIISQKHSSKCGDPLPIRHQIKSQVPRDTGSNTVNTHPCKYRTRTKELGKLCYKLVQFFLLPHFMQLLLHFMQPSLLSYALLYYEVPIVWESV